MVVAKRPNCTALLSLVELRPARIHFGVESRIAPFPRPAIGVGLADTGAFKPVHGTALAFLAGIVVVAGIAHLDGIRRVTARELAEPALTLMSSPSEIARVIVIFESKAAILHGIQPRITVLAGPAIGIRLTHAGAFRSIEAAALALFAGVIEIACVAHRHRIWGVTPGQLARAALALVPTAGDIAGFVIRLLGHTLILLEIEPGIAELAAAAIVVVVAFFLFRDVSRNSQIVIHAPLLLGAAFAHLVVGRRIQIGEMLVTATFAPILCVHKTVLVVQTEGMADLVPITAVTGHGGEIVHLKHIGFVHLIEVRAEKLCGEIHCEMIAILK